MYSSYMINTSLFFVVTAFTEEFFGNVTKYYEECDRDLFSYWPNIYIYIYIGLNVTHRGQK